MPSAYESLLAIKESTAWITEHIDFLKADGLLSSNIAEILKLMTTQVGAAACQSAMLNLAEREMRRASESEKSRLELEKRLHTTA